MIKKYIATVLGVSGLIVFGAYQDGCTDIGFLLTFGFIVVFGMSGVIGVFFFGSSDGGGAL